MTSRRNGSARVRVLRAARHSPHLTAVQIAAVAGCHLSTVRKHLNRAPGPVLALTSDTRRRVLAPDGPSTASALAGSCDSRTRSGLAHRSGCPQPLLCRLAADRDFGVRRRAAANRNCPPDMLARLAADADVRVRGDVANNANCPPWLLARLAGDPRFGVRRRVAGNANCPPWLLARLAGDVDGVVRTNATHNLGHRR